MYIRRCAPRHSVFGGASAHLLARIHKTRAAAAVAVAGVSRKIATRPTGRAMRMACVLGDFRRILTLRNGKVHRAQQVHGRCARRMKSRRYACRALILSRRFPKVVRRTPSGLVPYTYARARASLLL